MDSRGLCNGRKAEKPDEDVLGMHDHESFQEVVDRKMLASFSL